MKSVNLYRMLKFLLIAFGVIFLLTACHSGDGEDTSGSNPVSPGSAQENADEQRGGIKENVVLKPLEVDKETCWQGELLEIFYKPLGKMALEVHDNLATDNVLTLMVLAFTLWMAFQILRHVSSPTAESIGEFWTKILRKATLCFACGYLASSPNNVFYVLNTFVFPIYITLLELCGNILDLVNKEPESMAKAILLPGAPDPDKAICEVYNYNMSGDGACSLPDMTKVAISTSEFPQEPLQLMSCMACAIGSRLDVGYTVAMYAMTTGFFGFLVGCFLLAAFTITKLGFAMYLVDSIFRLDMMVIIAPFLILFYPFEQTRKWAITGFKIILNSSAIMLCMGILVSMTVLAMQKILVNDKIAEFGDVGAYSSLGVIPISLIFLGFIIIKAAGTAVSLSESVTGGGGDTKFQKKMAALVGTVANGLFTVFTMGAGKAVTFAVEHSKRLRAAAEKIEKTRAKARNLHQKMQHLAGRDERGEEE